MSALKSRCNSLAGLTLHAVLGGEIVTTIATTFTAKSNRTAPHNIGEANANTTTTTHASRYHTQRIRQRRTQRSNDVANIPRKAPFKTPRFRLDLINSNPSHLISQSIGLLNFKDFVCAIPMSDPPRAMFSRGSLMRVGSSKTNPEDSADVSIPLDGPPSRSFKPQLSRPDSVRDHSDVEEDNRRRPPIVTFVEERQMSAREAVAAQEAAEAEAAANASDDDDDNEEDDDETEEKKTTGVSTPKQTMSLMDLLEETDRQMGLTGSRYAMDEEYEEDEEEEEESYEEEGGGEGELSCCVCNVKIKGASFTPCGHTFCKLCSKELMAQKGHCPVCTSFVLEFLEIF